MSIRKTGQDGLMLWLQAHTSGYAGVNVVDFTRSWENGLAFCALIHSFYPDLIPFDTLKAEDKAANLKLAFDTADKLGVPALMDPEDMLMDCGPDKFSVITYVSQYFHKWKNIGQETGSDEVIVKAPTPALSMEDEMMKRRRQLDEERQRLEQEKMLARKCAKCSQGFPNGGTIIDALGKQYHPDCFICYSCSNAFKDNKFVNVDGNPYCQQCAKDKFSSKAINATTEAYDNPPCFKCKKLCEGDTVNALGHSWHPECFCCTTCNKVFTTGTSKVLNVDGFPYCEQCGRRAFVSRRTVTSPTPSQGLSKSKSMSAIPKMAESPGDSPASSKPFLGSTLSMSNRLNAFQPKPPAAEPEPAPKKEPGKLTNSFLARKQEEEQRKKKEEEEKEAKRKEDDRIKDEQRKKKEEDKLRKKQEDEEKKRKEQEEKEARKKEEEEAKKRKAEEAKKKKADEEARKKKEAEEEEERKKEKQEQVKRQRAESLSRKQEADEAKKKEEEAKKKEEEEKRLLKEAEEKEILRKKREERKVKGEEEEKKKEEAATKRTSIRFLQRSITETFVAHNKLADIAPTTTTTKLVANNSRPTSPVATPRDNSAPTTPRDGSSSTTTITLVATPRSNSSLSISSPHHTPPVSVNPPSPTASTAAASSSVLSPPTISPTPGATPANSPVIHGSSSASPPAASPLSPTLSSTTFPASASEKVVKLQSHSKHLCPAADVMCGWTGSSEGSVQAHTNSCPFYQLRPMLRILKQSNDDLTKRVDQLQQEHAKDREVIAALQAKLGL